MQQMMIHILLVEDSHSDARLLRQVFLRANQQEWQMTHVERLSAAINLSLKNRELTSHASPTPSFMQHIFNVVLLDLSLPDSTGIETLKEYRAAVPDIPVVVLTGIDDEELALQALAEGAQDYLVKDQITIQLLKRAVRYAIEREEILKKLRESEERSRQALLKEQELNELKSNFVAMVSHEFRNPMTTIRTALELLEHNNHKITNEQRNKYFERVQNAIKHMLQLLDEILFLSKSEAAKFEYQPQPLNIETFCSELVEEFRFGLGHQHIITFNSQGESFQAEMDENLLNFILKNLLSNAIKYSPENSQIQFDLNCQYGIATFKIKDQGRGIPLKDQPRLFQTFYRASNVNRVQGTGLGLAIVKQCVDIHGGEIKLESQENVGTTVIVKIPLHYVKSS